MFTLNMIQVHNANAKVPPTCFIDQMYIHKYIANFKYTSFKLFTKLIKLVTVF